MASIAVRIAFLLDWLAPKRDAAVHLAGHQLALEDKAKGAKLFFRVQIGTGFRRILRAVLPTIGCPARTNTACFLPSIEILPLKARRAFRTRELIGATNRQRGETIVRRQQAGRRKLFMTDGIRQAAWRGLKLVLLIQASSQTA